MSTTKRMTLEEIKSVPTMTKAERKKLKESPIQYDNDCPKLSKKELSKFRLYKDVAKEKRPVTLRLSENDIFALKQKADIAGLPYQTLVSSVLHRYVNNELVDKSEVRKVFAMVGA